MNPCTLRVLSLDGGGERGYLSTKWIQLFLQQAGIAGNEIWKYFDVIAGTSIGGIAALGYATGQTPEVLESFFVTKGPRIFTIRTVPIGCTADTDSNTPNNGQKAALIVLNDPFYKSPESCSGSANFGSDILYKTLTDTFGAATTMQDVKTNVLIPAYQLIDGTTDSGAFSLFSNVGSPFFRGQSSLITDVAKATSAAPVYLPSVTSGGKVYLDGGLYCNNPAQLALNLAKSLKPTASRFCVLSVGTGIGQMKFYDQPGGPTDPAIDIGFDTIQQIFGLFNVATTGGQEQVDTALKMESQNTLSNLFYYRFQPTLDPTLNTDLDSTKPDILAYYAKVAKDSFDADNAAISNFIGHLTA